MTISDCGAFKYLMLLCLLCLLATGMARGQDADEPSLHLYRFTLVLNADGSGQILREDFGPDLWDRVRVHGVPMAIYFEDASEELPQVDLPGISYRLQSRAVANPLGDDPEDSWDGYRQLLQFRSLAALRDYQLTYASRPILSITPSDRVGELRIGIDPMAVLAPLPATGAGRPMGVPTVVRPDGPLLYLPPLVVWKRSSLWDLAPDEKAVETATALPGFAPGSAVRLQFPAELAGLPPIARTEETRVWLPLDGDAESLGFMTAGLQLSSVGLPLGMRLSDRGPELALPSAPTMSEKPGTAVWAAPPLARTADGDVTTTLESRQPSADRRVTGLAAADLRLRQGEASYTPDLVALKTGADDAVWFTVVWPESVADAISQPSLAELRLTGTLDLLVAEGVADLPLPTAPGDYELSRVDESWRIEPIELARQSRALDRIRVWLHPSTLVTWLPLEHQSAFLSEPPRPGTWALRQAPPGGVMTRYLEWQPVPGSDAVAPLPIAARTWRSRVPVDQLLVLGDDDHTADVAPVLPVTPERQDAINRLASDWLPPPPKPPKKRRLARVELRPDGSGEVIEQVWEIPVDLAKALAGANLENHVGVPKTAAERHSQTPGVTIAFRRLRQQLDDQTLVGIERRVQFRDLAALMNFQAGRMSLPWITLRRRDDGLYELGYAARDSFALRSPNEVAGMPRQESLDWDGHASLSLAWSNPDRPTQAPPPRFIYTSTPSILLRGSMLDDLSISTNDGIFRLIEEGMPVIARIASLIRRGLPQEELWDQGSDYLPGSQLQIVAPGRIHDFSQGQIDGNRAQWRFDWQSVRDAIYADTARRMLADPRMDPDLARRWALIERTDGIADTDFAGIVTVFEWPDAPPLPPPSLSDHLAPPANPPPLVDDAPVTLDWRQIPYDHEPVPPNNRTFRGKSGWRFQAKQPDGRRVLGITDSFMELDSGADGFVTVRSVSLSIYPQTVLDLEITAGGGLLDAPPDHATVGGPDAPVRLHGWVEYLVADGLRPFPVPNRPGDYALEPHADGWQLRPMSLPAALRRLDQVRVWMHPAAYYTLVPLGDDPGLTAPPAVGRWTALQPGIDLRPGRYLSITPPPESTAPLPPLRFYQRCYRVRQPIDLWIKPMAAAPAAEPAQAPDAQ